MDSEGSNVPFVHECSVFSIEMEEHGQYMFKSVTIPDEGLFHSLGQLAVRFKIRRNAATFSQMYEMKRA